MTETNLPKDPTARTIETLHREVAGIRESTNLLIAGVERIVDERFGSVEMQFILLERQRVEQKNDTANAVAAALTAQKEAVGSQTVASERAIAKSEMATSKQLDQMTATFSASIGGVTDLLNDTKDRHGKLDTRVSNIETAKQSVTASRTESRDGTTMTVAILGVVIAILAILVPVVLAFT